MFFQRASSLAVVLFALVSTSSEAISLRRRLGATYSSDSNDWKQAMLTAVNEQRASNNLPALCLNSKLTSAAQLHSNDMAANDYMDHNGADGSTMSGRVTAAGYDWSYVAENVAAGQVDVSAVMTSWMNSEGHRANILSKDITMFGCGYAYDEATTYGHYWTQDFGAGSTETCDGASSGDQVAGEASESVDSSSDYAEPTAAPVTEPPAPSPVAVATKIPVTDAPNTEAPVTESPATEAPITDAPATEPPATKGPAVPTQAPVSSGCKARRH